MSSLLQRYPELSLLDKAGLAIIKNAQFIQVPSNTVLFRQGDPCNNFIMVISGTVKVLGRNAAGREIVLYRIEKKVLAYLPPPVYWVKKTIQRKVLAKPTYKLIYSRLAHLKKH